MPTTPEFIRPDADDVDGRWKDSAGGTTLFDKIDEEWKISGASIDLGFADGVYFDGSGYVEDATTFLSCSRASIGYAKTRAGALTSFATNTLRITDLGLLVEDARTNSLTYSQTFNTASWALGNITLGTAITAPDGTTTALKFEETAVNAQHRAFNGITTLTRSVPWTMSAYLKAAERRYAMLKLDDTNFGITIGIDLLTGTTWQPSDASTGWSSISSSVESLANGWFRLIVTGTPSGAGTSGTGQVFVSNVNSGNTFDGYLGTLGSGIYVWGVQVEQGAFASSYIPTTSASATRAADVTSFIGTAKTLLEANSDQSIVADVANNNPSLVSNNNQNIINDNGAANDSKLMFGTSGAAKNIAFAYHTVSSGSAQLGSGDFYSPFKCGFSQDASGMTIVGNAGTVDTDLNRMPLTNPRLGVKTDSDGTYAYIRRLSLWNSKLPDATLQGLTAP